MIWYILGRDDVYFYVADIYSIIHRDNNNAAIINGLYPVRLESKYRYSGVLYDKLRCLTSYVCYNYTDRIVDDLNNGRFVVAIKSSFDTQTMNIHYGERYTMYPSDSLFKNLYFIEN